jgi:amidase
MSMNRLCSMGAMQLGSLIRERQVSAGEVLEAHLAGIAAVNPTVNAVTVTLADSARAAAAAVDQALAAGQPLGPLAGVPFTVKENVDLQGSATSWGLKALAGQVAATDAPIVARLREAGAIPLARTNLPDFAFRWDTVSDRAGRTLNPWDPTRACGGSSGGEAVALATGMTPLGIGNDLGGSLRVPAQLCGVAALKPSRGRIAHGAVTQPWPEPLAVQMTNCQGPMARRVADLRLVLALASAPDPRDPRWVPAPLQGPRAEGRVRVALVRDPAGLGIAPPVGRGLGRAADWLANAGYEVVEAEPPNIAAVAGAWADAIWADFGQLLPALQPLAGAETVALIQRAMEEGVFKPVNQAAQQAVWMAIHQHAADWDAFLQQHPVVLAPVCCEPGWVSGEDLTQPARIAQAMRMVVPVNILGLPACALPVGCDEGLPQGVQLIGRRFREDQLLDAAQAIEDAAPAITPIDPARSGYQP